MGSTETSSIHTEVQPLFDFRSEIPPPLFHENTKTNRKNRWVAFRSWIDLARYNRKNWLNRKKIEVLLETLEPTQTKLSREAEMNNRPKVPHKGVFIGRWVADLKRVFILPYCPFFFFYGTNILFLSIDGWHHLRPISYWKASIDQLELEKQVRNSFKLVIILCILSLKLHDIYKFLS